MLRKARSQSHYGIRNSWLAHYCRCKVRNFYKCAYFCTFQIFNTHCCVFFTFFFTSIGGDWKIRECRQEKRRIYIRARRINRSQLSVIVKGMNCGRASRKRITISCGKRESRCSKRCGCYFKISHVELWEMFALSSLSGQTVRT